MSSPTSRQMLIDALIEMGYVQQAHVDSALREQEKSGREIGEIFLDMGVINRKQLDEARFACVRKVRSTFVHKQRAHIRSFGEIAREVFGVPEKEIEECIRIQAAEKENTGEEVQLGEVLVRRKLLSPEQVGQIIARQKLVILRCADCGKRFNMDYRAVPEKCPNCGGRLRQVISDHEPVARSRKAGSATGADQADEPPRPSTGKEAPGSSPGPQKKTDWREIVRTTRMMHRQMPKSPHAPEVSGGFKEAREKELAEPAAPAPGPIQFGRTTRIATKSPEKLAPTLPVQPSPQKPRAEKPPADAPQTPADIGVSLIYTELKDYQEAIKVILKNPRSGAMFARSSERDETKDFLLGKTRYALLETLREDGFTVEHAAIDRDFNRKVLLRTARLSSFESTAELKEFLFEPQMLAQLEHPSLPIIYDIGATAEHELYIVMKLVEGRTLREIIDDLAEADQGTIWRYPPAGLLNIICKACDGLHYAHSHGVIHRSLSPDRIIVGDHGEVTVTGWDSAKVEGIDEERVEQLRRRVDDLGAYRMLDERRKSGPASYMAPEVLAEKYTDIAPFTDVYSMGAILYELIGLKPPYSGVSPDEIIRQVLHGQLEPLEPAEYIRHYISASMLTVCNTALAKSHSLRYSHAGELGYKLQELLSTAMEGGGSTHDAPGT